MSRPEYVTNFEKPEHTAVKKVNGHWYLYECTYPYDPVRKRTTTKWGPYLGVVDEKGFHPKRDGDESEESGAVEAVLELGATRWCWEKTAEMRERLRKHFGDMWRQTYAVALLEAVSNDRLHRLAMRYRESILSRLLPGIPMSAASLSRMMEKLGTMRESMEAYMREDVERSSRFLLVDGHRVLSAAADNPSAKVGHDSRRRWRPQINLIYMFDTGRVGFGRPVYYEQFDGSTPDLSAVPEMLSSLGVLPDHCIYVGDKGCGSERIIGAAAAAGVSHCVPLRRDNRFTKGRIPGNGGYQTTFLYRDRPIQATCLPQDGFNVFLFYDIDLCAEETASLTQRCEKRNDRAAASRSATEKRLAALDAKLAKAQGKLDAAEAAGKAEEALEGLRKAVEALETEKKMLKKIDGLRPIDISAEIASKPAMGAITLRTNQMELAAREAFLIYKKREAIEDFFKLCTVTLGDEGSYARNEQLMESWLFLNHLSAWIASTALDMIDTHGMRGFISWDDCRRSLATIRALLQDGRWRVAPVDPEAMRVCLRLDIDPYDLRVLEEGASNTG